MDLTINREDKYFAQNKSVNLIILVLFSPDCVVLKQLIWYAAQPWSEKLEICFKYGDNGAYFQTVFKVLYLRSHIKMTKIQQSSHDS